MKLLSLILISISIAFAQVSPPVILPPNPPPAYLQLKSYLQLSDAQFVQLFQNMEGYRRAVSQRQQRNFDLQREISQEIVRPSPDAVAVGSRYVELEINCRLMDDESKQLAERNQGLLTEAQKTRLKALDDALKLYPIISEAQQTSLLDSGNPFASPIFAGGSGNLIGGIIGPGPVFPAPGCSFSGRFIGPTPPPVLP